ncbi:hypothetical protein KI387_035329, partial [Taxus chinensis]
PVQIHAPSPVPISFDFYSAPKMEKVGPQGRAVDAWIQCLLSQGKRIIKDAIDAYNDVEKAKLDVDKLNGELLEENGNWELTLEDLSELKKAHSDILIKEAIVADSDRPFEFYKAIEFRVKILQEAC